MTDWPPLREPEPDGVVDYGMSGAPEKCPECGAPIEAVGEGFGGIIYVETPEEVDGLREFGVTRPGRYRTKTTAWECSKGGKAHIWGPVIVG